jgi:hypothetical protein
VVRVHDLHAALATYAAIRVQEFSDVGPRRPDFTCPELEPMNIRFLFDFRKSLFAGGCNRHYLSIDVISNLYPRARVFQVDEINTIGNCEYITRCEDGGALNHNIVAIQLAHAREIPPQFPEQYQEVLICFGYTNSATLYIDIDAHMTIWLPDLPSVCSDPTGRCTTHSDPPSRPYSASHSEN